MKRIVTFILLLGSPLAADDNKLAPAKQPAEGQAKEKEPPAPKTLDEAHEQLEKQLPKEELIDAMKSEEEMIEYHFGLGMGMRNSWGL